MADRKYNFFESYHRALALVPDDSYGRVVRAMSAFVFEGLEPNLTEAVDMVAWELIKPILVKGSELAELRSNAGRRGGLSGKGISKNIGNLNAKKQNNSKSIANQKQINSGEGEGEGEGIVYKESSNEPKKDRLSLTTDQRKEKFRESIMPLVEEFGPENCNDFYSYWTEPTPSGKKMRFELEKTWDVRRRLQRWCKKIKVS